MLADRRPVKIDTIKVDPVSLNETIAFISSVAASNGKATIFYANAHGVNLAATDPTLRKAFDKASLVFCDGKSIQWAARFLGRSIPERFTPPDWIHRLGHLAVEHDYRMFFLGGEPGVAEAAAEQLRSQLPRVQIASHHGYFTQRGSQNERVIRIINSYQPELLLVGFGMPHQELWISNHLEQLNMNVALSVGGLFDFLSGAKRRGPRWLTDIGLEWLTRLATEPGRLGRRYIIGNPQFALRVIRQRLRMAVRQE